MQGYILSLLLACLRERRSFFAGMSISGDELGMAKPGRVRRHTNGTGSMVLWLAGIKEAHVYTNGGSYSVYDSAETGKNFPPYRRGSRGKMRIRIVKHVSSLLVFLEAKSQDFPS